MTNEETQRVINGQLLAMQLNCSPFAGLMGQAVMFGLLNQRQASTFNYRKFNKPGEYRKGELRRIVTMIAENGYIRRAK